ncbi:MAG: RNA polymerase sigma factor [Dehalococcoidia bacterium]|nr:RNA polymerase sigma factor [Dehalococcoidia bacterium]
MMSSVQRSDAELVRLSLQGQSEAFGSLYDRYFPALYDFLRRTMRNADEAADLVQETFLKAMENLPALSSPASFKSWLFSIAHHQALNRLERQKRIATPPAEDGDGEDGGLSDPLLSQVDTDRLVDPEQAAQAHETADLVWEAAKSLDPRTYAVLDLHVRQGLESAEIAEVLGVSKGNAYTMLNRMKKSVEEAIGAFLLARRGSRECERLREILSAFVIPPITPGVRRAVDRHVRGCDVCERTRRRLLSPLEVLGAFACVPAPVGLKERVWGELERQWPGVAASYSAQQSAAPGGRGGGDDGWRRLLGGGRRRRGFAALVVAAVIAFVPVFFFAPSLWSGEGASPTATPTATSRPTRTPTPLPTKTRTPSPSPSPRGEPTATPAAAAIDTPIPSPTLPAATPTLLPTAAPTSTAAPPPTATPTPSPFPTITATPTPTPTPTQTPTITPPLL